MLSSQVTSICELSWINYSWINLSLIVLGWDEWSWVVINQVGLSLYENVKALFDHCSVDLAELYQDELSLL